MKYKPKMVPCPTCGGKMRKDSERCHPCYLKEQRKSIQRLFVKVPRPMMPFHVHLGKKPKFRSM